jgi:hypothetical protein
VADHRIVEEYFENLATGVEQESDLEEDLENIDRPWRPELIRVSTKPFSLRNILDFIEDESLELAPDFQRLKVWKRAQKSQLIESILLQIPLPVFYFSEDREGVLRVVDGLQRLSTINDFVRGSTSEKFSLIGLEYLHEANGMFFEDLPAKWQRRLSTTQIIAHVIDPSTPAEVKYDVFRRINTGGTPLNAQEIRHCMSKARSRDFLKICTYSPAFIRATDGALSQHPRMVDREAVLRFVAFSLYERQYRQIGGSMESVLSYATERLDDPHSVTDDELSTLFQRLNHGCDRARKIFGQHAYRKWSLSDPDRKNPFNRALFESWTVVLSENPGWQISPDEVERIRQRARKAMTTDYSYLNAITQSTGDPRRVEERFKTTREIVEQSRQ